MTFDDIPSGWLVNSCHQHDDGSWTINLRKPEADGYWFTDPGRAPTFEEAFDLAIDLLETAEFAVERKLTASIDTRNGLSLSNIGLHAQPKITISRRTLRG